MKKRGLTFGRSLVCTRYAGCQAGSPVSAAGTTPTLLLMASMFVLSIILVLPGHTAAQETAAVVQTPAEIRGIEVIDNGIVINIAGPFTYKVVSTDDPFRVLLELEGVSLGKFNKKIFSYKRGITEITPTQAAGPRPFATLDILLNSPAEVKAEAKDSGLILSLGDAKASSMRVATAPPAPAVETPVVAGQKAKGPVADAANEIQDVVFEQDGRRIELVLRGDGSFSEPTVVMSNNRVTIDVPAVAMRAVLPMAPPYPVSFLRQSIEKGKVRLTVDLSVPVHLETLSLDDEIIIAFTPKETRETKAEVEKRGQDKAQAARDSEVVSLDFQDGDVVAILRLLGDVSGYNMVIHPDVKGKITLKLMNVPWEQALEIILKTFSLERVVDGNVIRVAPASVFAKEKTDVSNLRRAATESEPLRTRVFPVSYARPAPLQQMIKDSRILSARGSMSFDERTSSLIVNDVESTFPQIVELLNSLDKPTRQVQIESRIVEINSTAARDLGVQWGINYKAPSGLLSVGGLQGLGVGPFTGGPNNVNVPAGNPNSGISFGIMNAAGTLGLDIQLSAIESANKGRVVSSPRVVTLDNEKAKIMQGQSVPYAQRDPASGQITAAFKDVAISIEVIPHITPANSVLVSLLTNKEELIGFVQISQGSTAPQTTKVEAKTNVLVQNGETIVIGGLLKKTLRQDMTGTPGISRIPLLGWLFKQERNEEDNQELIIFITPRIVDQ